MWRLCWLQLLCHHSPFHTSVQGLDYTKFSLRTLPCVKFLYLLSATLYTTTYDPPLLSLFLSPPFYHLSSSASLHLLFPRQLFIPMPALLLLSHSFVFHIFVFIFCLCYSLHFALLLSSPPSFQYIVKYLSCTNFNSHCPGFMVGQEILVCRQTDSLN